MQATELPEEVDDWKECLLCGSFCGSEAFEIVSPGPEKGDERKYLCLDCMDDLIEKSMQSEGTK